MPGLTRKKHTGERSKEDAVWDGWIRALLVGLLPVAHFFCPQATMLLAAKPAAAVVLVVVVVVVVVTTAATRVTRVMMDPGLPVVHYQAVRIIGQQAQRR